MATEQKVEELHAKVAELEEQRLAKIEAKIDEFDKRQRAMEKQLEKYAARWGMLFMLGSAVLAALKLFWADIARFFGK